MSDEFNLLKNLTAETRATVHGFKSPHRPPDVHVPMDPIGPKVPMGSKGQKGASFTGTAAGDKLLAGLLSGGGAGAGAGIGGDASGANVGADLLKPARTAGDVLVDGLSMKDAASVVGDALVNGLSMGEEEKHGEIKPAPGESVVDLAKGIGETLKEGADDANSLLKGIAETIKEGGETKLEEAKPAKTFGADDLTIGSSGPVVTKLQNDLNSAGYPVGVDGQYGPETRAVVRRFQDQNGLESDGVAGPNTLARLALVLRNMSAFTPSVSTTQASQAAGDSTVSNQGPDLSQAGNRRTVPDAQQMGTQPSGPGIDLISVLGNMINAAGGGQVQNQWNQAALPPGYGPIYSPEPDFEDEDLDGTVGPLVPSGMAMVPVEIRPQVIDLEPIGVPLHRSGMLIFLVMALATFLIFFRPDLRVRAA